MNKTTRYLDRDNLPAGEKLLEFWFAPKAFESEDLYERLGVLLLKRYVPTGGDFFIQKYGVRIVDVEGNVDSLIHFEQLTRIQEALHLFFFLFFSIISFRRWISGKISFLHFLFEVLVYIVLILSPAELQRYNRIRLYRVIRLMSMKKRSGKN